MNEDGSNGCVRRAESYTDSTGSAPGNEAAPVSTPIWLDELICSGDEQELGECQRAAGWGVTDCGHKEDAGCVCTPRPTVSPVRGIGLYVFRKFNISGNLPEFAGNISNSLEVITSIIFIRIR